MGPLIQWNFPNILVARARIAGARASADAALATFDGTWLRALQETETALSAYAGQLDRVTALASARDQSARSRELVQARFKAGYVSSLDVVDADRTLADAEAALAQAQGALSDDQIALFLALGGGWRPRAPPRETSRPARTAPGTAAGALLRRGIGSVRCDPWPAPPSCLPWS